MTAARRTDYGRRLIPCLIDEKASAVPQEVYCYIPRTSNVKDGFRPITFICISNAINACSWWIEAEVGKSDDFNTLAYLGPSDPRNIIIILAAIKTGHKALLSSPRNSLDAHLDLLAKSGCRVLLTADPRSNHARDILKQRYMNHLVVPPVEHWLDSPIVAPYAYIKTFDEARYEPFVVVHTSGSTGLPKAVILNHGTLAASDAWNGYVADDGQPHMVLNAISYHRCFVSMPLFHIAGIDFMLAKALYQGIVPILSPTDVPVTAELVDSMHRLDLVEMSIVAPSVLQDIAACPASLENMRQINATMYGGGPLPPEAGNAIASKTRLYNLMGSSEMANVPTEEIDGPDWEYLKFTPQLGYKMQLHSENLFELSFLREPSLELFQSIFSTFPDRQEYFTRDLYSMHPTKADLWKYEGRADDIITLTNGEKVNPLAMEKSIAAHPDVAAVLVVGQARFQTALLVEAKMPSLCNACRESSFEDLWCTVQHANSQCNSHERISKDLIMFTSQDKPFYRAGKGTVQRQATVNAYRSELDKLYDDFKRLTNPQTLIDVTAVNPCKHSEGAPLRETRVARLRSLLRSVTGWSNINPDADFFSLGMDSLHVINLVHAINVVAGASGAILAFVTAKTIYSNPTLNSLSGACTIASQPLELQVSGMQSTTATDMSNMDALLSKYSWDLPISGRPPAVLHSDDRMEVMLTGSTGSLGSYLLDTLLKNPKIAHVHCLNRSENSEERQRLSNTSRGLSTDWFNTRISFHQSDFSQEYLGLNINVYRYLLDNITHIIHNAWEVNFNHPLSSFETPHILGIRQLIDFSARSAKGARIFFISSISSAMNWSLNHMGPVPERIVDDTSAPLPMGYAQSKYVAERLLDQATRIAGIPTTICRVGQVAGPVKTHGVGGVWNKSEWLPSLISSSKYLGMIPESLGPNDMIDWVPVDILSKILVDLLVSSWSIETSDAQADTSKHLTEGDKDAVNGAESEVANLGTNKSSHPASDRAPTASSFQDADMGTKISHAVNAIAPTAKNIQVDAVNYRKIDPHEVVNGTCSNTQSSDTWNKATKTYPPSYPETNTDDPPAPPPTSATVYHLTNPYPTTWSTLLPTIKSYVPLHPVPLRTWLAALTSSIPTTNPDLNPAIRLSDFYLDLLHKAERGETNPIFSTAETMKHSEEMRKLEGVKEEWMGMWMEGWGFCKQE